MNNCLDGTKDCPVGGTNGSWGFYVMGIFMACVFQLGPKTKYGESEQNPAYWLHLLLTAKENGAKVNWYDPVKDQVQERPLTTGDWRYESRRVVAKRKVGLNPFALSSGVLLNSLSFSYCPLPELRILEYGPAFSCPF